MKNRIILGVTGGIAAYKAGDVARRLMDRGFSVQVVMTASAEAFITPLTFEALTGVPVIRAGMPAPGEEPMPHITVPRKADLFLVAPATANIIGKLAHGVADDALSTMLLASGLPTIMAPAMNTIMYENPAVQENIKTLSERGVRFVGPASGTLACGDEGKGKMADVEEIVTAVMETLRLKRDLEGAKMIVTTGGTREPVDPVRFIGNRSSGKMGIAIAEAAAMRGADVTLIAASVEAAIPEGLRVVRAQTASDMLSAVKSGFAQCDVLVMTAAVGDYRALKVSNSKVKKKENWVISLEKNPDILAEMGAIKKGRVIVGFAAETEGVNEYGRQKLLSKNLDMIVTNDVSRDDIGFGSDFNEVTIITRGGEHITTPRSSKSEIANVILDRIAEMLKRSGGNRAAEKTG